MSKGKKRSGARPGRPQPLRGTKGKRKGARLWYEIGRRFSRNAETDLVCRLLLEKKKNKKTTGVNDTSRRTARRMVVAAAGIPRAAARGSTQFGIINAAGLLYGSRSTEPQRSLSNG